MQGLPEPRTNKNNLTTVRNYPNPFCSVTTVEYELEQAEPVILKIYNHLGQEVIRLVNEQQPKGIHQVQWEAAELPAGIYFCGLAVGGQRSAVNGKIVKY